MEGRDLQESMLLGYPAATCLLRRVLLRRCRDFSSLSADPSVASSRRLHSAAALIFNEEWYGYESLPCSLYRHLCPSPSIYQSLFRVGWGKRASRGKLTSILHWNKGPEMVPTIGQQGTTLLVRKFPYVDTKRVFVGDVVFLKDLERDNKCLGGQCWVLSDNESLKPKEARDSRIFGPVSVADIMGRVIYSLRSAVDHGPIKNSRSGMLRDNPVLAVELDVDEMAQNHKA
ncbi:hypothetical protein ACLOJK_005565 [Asimina triloba]